MGNKNQEQINKYSNSKFAFDYPENIRIFRDLFPFLPSSVVNFGKRFLFEFVNHIAILSNVKVKQYIYRQICVKDKLYRQKLWPLFWATLLTLLLPGSLSPFNLQGNKYNA